MKTARRDTERWNIGKYCKNRDRHHFFKQRPEARGQRLEERKHEIKREDETRTGLGFGVWKEQKETFSVCRNESALIRHSELDSESGFALRRRSRVGARDDGIGVRDDSIGALRDDRVGGLRKFSPSRERSELSIFLTTLHAPLSTVLNRTLECDLSRDLTLYGS